MKEYDEMREAVVAEYGAPVSSALVDKALKEAYSSLGEMPKPQPRPSAAWASPRQPALRAYAFWLG